MRAFYREVINSDLLSPYFQGVDLEALIEHQTKFISHALGGPAQYTGRSLKAAHQNLQISGEAFAEVAEILQECLEDAGMSDEDVATVMGIVGSTRGDIVTGER